MADETTPRRRTKKIVGPFCLAVFPCCPPRHRPVQKRKHTEIGIPIRLVSDRRSAKMISYRGGALVQRFSGSRIPVATSLSGEGYANLQWIQREPIPWMIKCPARRNNRRSHSPRVGTNTSNPASSTSLHWPAPGFYSASLATLRHDPGCLDQSLPATRRLG